MRVKRSNFTSRTTLGNPFFERNIGESYQETFQLEEAVVVDVVINDEHPEYDVTDGYNVGAVRFRFLSSNSFQPDSELNWAFPIESNITDYPLLNEIVMVIPALNRFYYFRKLNISNRVTSHPLFGLNDSFKTRQTGTERSDEYQAGIDGSAKRVNVQAEADRLGEVFEEKDSVFRLRSKEGDIIYEGRFGQSIRFGSTPENDQAPTVLIRCGPNPRGTVKPEGSRFGLVDEELNKDLSSIWLIADQKIQLDFATVTSENHFVSMDEPPSALEGSQIIVNTNQLVLNTRGGKLLVSTFLGTHFSTRGDHTVDTDKDYRSFTGANRLLKITENYEITVDADYLLRVEGDKTSDVAGATIHRTVGNHSIVGDKIFIGSLDDEGEPMVIGETLRKFIDQFLNIFISNAAFFTIPTIGIGPLNPGVLSQISALRATFGIAAKESSQDQGFLSRKNFVTRTNG